MYSGKLLRRIFPLSWGTHCYFNKVAYSLIKKEGIKVNQEFPSLKLINSYEDFNGPDGAWIRGEYPTSNMVYNPDTDKGDGPREAMRLLKNLFLALKEKNLTVAAKEAAWLAHILTDFLWPPHQVGKYHNTTIRFFFWNIKTNWYDGLIGSFWHKYDKHAKIEVLTALSLWQRKIGLVGIDRSFIQEAKNNYQIIENYLKNKAAKTHQSGIYEKFIKEGWDVELKKDIAQYVFPEVISTVATLWYLAYILNKEE